MRSRAVLTGLLRDGLGFTGVTITDALDMAAVGEGRSGHRLTEICAQDPAEREDRCRFRVVVESLDPKYVRLVPLSGKIGADFGAGGSAGDGHVGGEVTVTRVEAERPKTSGA